MVYLFLADGFEEIEALATADILRRAGVKLTTVSVTATTTVTGAHNIQVHADALLSDLTITDPDMLILPGGMPGATNLANTPRLTELLRYENARGTNIAAICASPAVVLAPLGILQGREAICYPGFEPKLTGAKISDNVVVTDGNITTAAGPGFSMEFALALVRILCGDGIADEVAEGLLLIVG